MNKQQLAVSETELVSLACRFFAASIFTAVVGGMVATWLFW
jgi:hypothetical protein